MRLYSEMVTIGALIHGDVARRLDFSGTEHSAALQLGGGDPHALAHCALLADPAVFERVAAEIERARESRPPSPVAVESDA